MKKIEILAAFEREINKLDDNLSKPVTDDSVYWINQAISKFSKERFNGNAPHRTSYEQNEKRLRDLNNLYTTYTIYKDESGRKLFYPPFEVYEYGKPILSNAIYIIDGELQTPSDPLLEYDKTHTYGRFSMCIHEEKVYMCIQNIDEPEEWNKDHWSQIDKAAIADHLFSEYEPSGDPIAFVPMNLYSSYAKYTVTYPSDLMFVLNEDATITDSQGKNEYITSVFECTKDSFMYRITNSLTDFHYNHHKARPLRVVDTVNSIDNSKTNVDLMIESNGGIPTYLIKSYQIGYLRFPNEFSLDNPNNEYTDFTDIVLYEIVKIAAQMYLENQGDQRYRTITNEVLTQE